MIAYKYAYIFLEVLILITILLFLKTPKVIQKFFNRKFWFISLILFIFWFGIDQIALAIGLWAFPPDNNIFSVLILGLPIEEYGLFFLHSVFCVLLIGIFYDD